MPINEQMIDFVIDLLKSRIPGTYYYHNYKHSLYVMEKVLEIGHHEKCSEKELDLLATAALWHDTGYINVYKGHEEESCRLVQKYLPDFGYSESDIEKIFGMIMATKIPQSPKNKLEEIVADADLEYLGTDNAAEMANDLFKELNALNAMLSMEAWNKTEFDFLTNHHYFTGFCKENKQPKKEAYLSSLRNSQA